jgi:hypothetical protein
LKISIESSEPLDDVLRVVGALYDVTLTATPVGAPADGSSATTARGPRSGRSRAATAPSRNGRRRSRTRVTKVSNAELRAWARDNGHTVSDRGRIPASVAQAYRDAQAG